MDEPAASDVVSCPGLRVVALDQVLRFLANPPVQGTDLPERPPEWQRLVAACVLCLLERRDSIQASHRFYDELDRGLALGLVAREGLSDTMVSLVREGATWACRQTREP